MLKYLIAILFALVSFLGICNLFVKKVPLKMVIQIAIIAFSGIASVILVINPLSSDPFSQQYGALKPKFPQKQKLVKMPPDRKNSLHMFHDQSTQEFKIDIPPGCAVQPFGPYVPF